jgi:hypothetical protein
MKRVCLLLTLMLSGVIGVFAQNNAIPENEKAVYLKVITERADKIATLLNINNAKKQEKVRNVIRDQYNNLNDIYTERDANVKAIKTQHEGNKAVIEVAIKEEATKTGVKLAKLHKSYLSKLSSKLSAEQVEQVKNGRLMVYCLSLIRRIRSRY